VHFVNDLVADAISSVYTVIVNSDQFAKCIGQLGRYTGRYFTRMNASNQLYVRQLEFCLENIQKFTQTFLSKGGKTETIMTSNEFVNACRIDNINILRLKEYLKESRLAQKLHGFVEANPSIVAGSDKKQGVK
jgi:chromosome transmission fidelity protein 1